MRMPLALVAALSLLSSSAAAQEVMTLRAGFTPDPRTLTMKAGGDIEVNMGECTYGYIAESGAMGIEYTAGSLDLYVYAEGDGDTMLVIETPSGDVLCDDDSHGSLNPLIHIEDPESGLYVVFVGSYTQGAFQEATVYVSELNPGSGDAGGESIPSLGLAAEFGTVQLGSGFAPDPHQVSLTAGGDLDLSVDDCSYGYVSQAPSYELTYSGSSNADLHFYVRAADDTTLLINTPNGSWVCDDDSLGDSNPQLTIADAASGVYDIWVGTYSGQRSSATLYISGKAAK
jgi:hypothetical protein